MLKLNFTPLQKTKQKKKLVDVQNRALFRLQAISVITLLKACLNYFYTEYIDECDK